jgi:hypothetical protein
LDIAGPALTRNSRQGIDVLQAMAGHVRGDGTTWVQFSEADHAVTWLHAVAAYAARAEDWDLLEEAARAMCEWDGAWDQWAPQDVIRPWLRSLTGDAAGLVASVLLDHPHSARHFADLAGERAVDSRVRRAVHASLEQRS